MSAAAELVRMLSIPKRPGVPRGARVYRGNMRMWALRWRAHMQRGGPDHVALAQMCLDNALGWRSLAEVGT